MLHAEHYRGTFMFVLFILFKCIIFILGGEINTFYYFELFKLISDASAKWPLVGEVNIVVFVL